MNEDIKVIIDADEDLTIELADKIIKVDVPVYPELENLTVVPSAEEQIFNHENSYGYDEVKVAAVSSESLEINPTVESQEYNGLYGNVKVNAVTSEIDENLIAENIKDGVEILGVTGNFVGGKFKPRYLYNTLSFQNYTGTELDHEVSMIDTTHLTALNNSFCNCSRITSLDLSEWNTGNVTTMFRTFYWCQSLISLNLSGWNTSNVTTMSNMFDYCNQLSYLDLSSFNTSKVTDMSAMFNMCQKLKHLDIRNFTFDKVSKSSSMFSMVPTDCLIIVKGETEKQWILTNGNSSFKNVKTVAEYEAS